MNNNDPELPVLVAGVDVRRDGRVRMAFLEPDGCEYPYSGDFHSSKTLSSFERYWLRRFGSCRELKLVAAMEDGQPPSLLLWLMQSKCEVLTLESCDLRPFRREAANYDIPTRYRRAHAVAQCAVTRLRAPQWLARIRGQLGELNFQLREVENSLTRLYAARTFA